MALPVKKTDGKRVVGDGTPGPGRTKGVPNKLTREIKEMVIQALSDVGGVEYLVGQAMENPTAFLTLVGKVIPLQIHATHTVKRDELILETRRQYAAQFENGVH